jgi:hypothetical protein
MAKQRITETRREPVGEREGYQGKAIPAGAKPVKSPAADVPTDAGKDPADKPSK